MKLGPSTIVKQATSSEVRKSLDELNTELEKAKRELERVNTQLKYHFFFESKKPYELMFVYHHEMKRIDEESSVNMIKVQLEALERRKQLATSFIRHFYEKKSDGKQSNTSQILEKRSLEEAKSATPKTLHETLHPILYYSLPKEDSSDSDIDLDPVPKKYRKGR